MGPRDFSCLQNVLTGLGAHPASYSVTTRAFSWGGGLKKPGHEVYYSSPYSANECGCSSSYPVYLHGMERDNLTFASVGTYVHYS